MLKDLIETNIRQRGIDNPNPVKLGRCIKELERIYGVREGRPEKLSKISEVNQSDIADGWNSLMYYHDNFVINVLWKLNIDGLSGIIFYYNLEGEVVMQDERIIKIKANQLCKEYSANINTINDRNDKIILALMKEFKIDREYATKCFLHNTEL